MIIIFSFSNQPATESSKLSNSVIRNTISKIIKNDSDEVLEKYTRPVRKLAHFSIYLVLGFLVLNCFKISKRNIIYTVLICFYRKYQYNFHLQQRDSVLNSRHRRHQGNLRPMMYIQ